MVPYYPLIPFPYALGWALETLALWISAGQKVEFPAGATSGEIRDRNIFRPKGKFLLVDDEPAVCEVMRAILEDSGLSCITAESGAAAVSLFAEHQSEIAAVITDVNMPGLGGVALATALRGLSPSLKIALMTGSHPSELEDGLYGLGERIPVLLKPFSKRALLDCVAQLR